MSGGSSAGISTRAFTIGLICAILISGVSTYVALKLTGVGGPQGLEGIAGEMGSSGAQGPQGLKGDKGDPGGVEPDVTASLTSTYTDVWLGTDYHDVEGLLINFGTDPAYSVTITITWHIIGGGEHTEPADVIGTLSGHEIYDYSERYYIEGSFDYITWEITWI